MKKNRIPLVMLIALGVFTLFLCVALICCSIVSPLLKLKKGFENTFYSEAFGCTLRVNDAEYSGIVSITHDSFTVFTEVANREIAFQAEKGEFRFAYHIELLDMWVSAALPDEYAEFAEDITSLDIRAAVLRLALKLFLNIDVNALPKIDYEASLEKRMRSLSFIRDTLGLNSKRKQGSTIISLNTDIEELLLELLSESKDEFGSEEEYERAKADCIAAVEASGNSAIKAAFIINDNDEMTKIELCAPDINKTLSLSFHEIGTTKLPNAF